jgi:hypothetical protein
MRTSCGSRAALLLALAALGASAPVHAQSTGIAVERFAPAVGPSSFGQVESAAVPLPDQLWLSAGLLGIGRPLVLNNALTGAEVAVPVAYRTTLDLAGEVGLWRQRLSIGMGVPISLWQTGDRLQMTGVSSNNGEDAGAPLQTTALGDIRFRVKGRLTPLDASAALAVVLEVTLPGGGQHDFVATSYLTAAPRLVGSFRHRWLLGAVNLGVRFAPERILYQNDLHHQFEWGAALGAILPVRRVGMAVYGEATGYVNLVSPNYESGAELRAALRLGWFRWIVDVGGGGGFGNITPEWRAFLLFRTFVGKSGISGCPVRPITF